MSTIHPIDARKTREKALEQAVRSMAGRPAHMTEIANRAHYFAHYLADDNRNQICDTIRCPYSVVLVPNAPVDLP